MKKSLYIFFLFFSLAVSATHNRAGEITYTRIAPFTQYIPGVGNTAYYNYLITVTKYTDETHGNHVVADRCADTVYFGDGTHGVAYRTNGPVGPCGCGSTPCGDVIITDPNYYVKVNTYTVQHTYGAAGTYKIHSYDANRNAGVKNIPNSDDQYFYLESYLYIYDFTGPNSSPVFNNLPIDRACVNKCFYHNPAAYDPDGDLLTYEISTSRGQDGNTVPGYSMPGPPGNYGINANTGLLSWCTPTASGEYNLAFIVTEWRKNTSGTYVIVGSVLRDMQVVVGDCPNNDPPFVNAPKDTCVETGTLITKKIFFGDPNVVSTITLQGSGGAFSCASPNATLLNTVFTTAAGQTTAAANFSWQTTCDHIRLQPYQTVFKATDDGIPALISGAPIRLVYFATYNIRVVPSGVKNVTATPQGSSIQLNWQLSNCNPANNPITAYYIYRKNDCTPVVFDPCQGGVPLASGYASIGITSPTISTFIDSNNGNGLTVGQDYSYLVVAVYKDGSQSYGNTQVCTKLKRNIPVLLNVDILSTSATNGSVFLRWEKPLTNIGNLDTVALPGPYQFNLKYRTGSSGAFTTVYNSTSPYFLNLDTQFTHTAVNTIASDLEYQVEFIANTTTVGVSQRASSIYLAATPGDRQIQLQWTAFTPWNNYKYTVYRKDPLAATFHTIAVTTSQYYKDTGGVVNSNSTRNYFYCYKILGEGQYSDPSITKPLLNNSQELCATAVDLTPPCAPTLAIEADCPTGRVNITWNNVTQFCSDDVVKYVLSYKPTIDAPYNVVATLTGPASTVFLSDGLELISGCYAVQSVDSSNNVSTMSPDFCIDNCPLFDLPNIITLNGDGVNDFFKAIRVRQIKEIDLTIFDRWGNLVYKTKDPYFNWDGTSLQSKQVVSEGTFFYICDVFEPRLKGVVKRNLKGYVQVVK